MDWPFKETNIFKCLRWEFIKDNKKVRKHTFDQESDEDKKKKRKKTCSPPRKQSRKNENGQEKKRKHALDQEKKTSFFFPYFLVFFSKFSPLSFLWKRILLKIWVSWGQFFSTLFLGRNILFNSHLRWKNLLTIKSTLRPEGSKPRNGFQLVEEC